MTDRKKMQDPRIWVRMGGELAALEELASKILCDRDYNAEINEVKSGADARSAHSPMRLSRSELFYGHALDPVREMIGNLGEKLKLEALARSDRLYDLTEADENG